MPDHADNNPLYWRDEILQVMYWMTGEGLGEEFTTEDLKKFLAADDDMLGTNLDLLTLNGFVELRGGGRYTLTSSGNLEGGRRFADEFEEMMRPGHYECSEPDCDCHDPEFKGEACKHLFHPEALN